MFVSCSPLFFCNASCRYEFGVYCPYYTQIVNMLKADFFSFLFLLFFFLSFLSPSTSMWGVYSETCIHHYNIPLAPSFTRLCIINSPTPPPPPPLPSHMFFLQYTCFLGHSIHIFYSHSLKSTQVRLSVHRHEAWKGSKTAICSCLFLELESHKFYQRCNASQRLRKLDRPDTAWQRTCKFQKANFTSTESNGSGQMTPSNSRFSRPSFCRLCWLWCVYLSILMHDSNLLNNKRSSKVRGMTSVRASVLFFSPR